MTKRHSPPGLTSMCCVVVVKPFGPHHCTICFGSVHAFHTSARGASKLRVNTSSRSLSLSFLFRFCRAMFLPLLFAVLRFLHLFLQQGVEGVEALVPDLAHMPRP